MEIDWIKSQEFTKVNKTGKELGYKKFDSYLFPIITKVIKCNIDSRKKGQFILFFLIDLATFLEGPFY